MTPPLLEGWGVYYRYSPRHWAIENATLRLEEEGRFVILSPNGGGEDNATPHPLNAPRPPER